MAVVEEKDIGTIKVKRRKPKIATHAMSDQIAEEDKLGFRDYVDAFVGLITSPDTKPPLTIGIYGPWGAGKSTLMDMIKDKLELQGAKKYLFSWDNVPGNDSERLLRYLRDNFSIGWAETAEIRKFDDGKTIRIFKDGNSAEIKIDEKEEKATLKISDGRTHDLKVKKENGTLNIYQNLMERIKKWFASIKKRLSYLSSIDAKKIEEDLNKKIISDDLKNKFKTKGFLLSENATIRKEKDGEWKITDEENLYIVKKKDKKLNIYKSELQTIQFNAWLYSKERKLWTAFMKEIFEEIEKKLTWENKLKFFCSYPRRKVKIRALLLILPILAVMGGFYYLKTLIGVYASGLLGSGALVWHFFDVIKKPITAELLPLIEKKDEKEELGLMSKIRADIRFLNKFFEENKPNTKIIIFVDDLDRCPDDTSVDVLESVSLLLNINCFIVILGVEEEILHKAIKLRYEELLDKSSTAEKASEVDFLDKIVQIPFYIPQDTDLKEYVLSLIGPKKDKTGEEDSNIKPEPTIPKPLEDSEDEQKWFVEWQKYLPKNPRKVKRLINIYRLVKILAGNKKGVEFIKEPGNQSKLIKWLIICEQCSYFTKEINLNSEAKRDTFLPSGLTSIIEKYKGVIKDQEDIKTLEEFINTEPHLGVEDIENFNKFTANFYPPWLFKNVRASNVVKSG
jgi:hypothetical protein